MDWPSIILATFLIVFGIVAIVLTGMVSYRLFVLPYKKIQINIRDRGFISAVLIFLLAFFLRFAKEIGISDEQYKAILAVVFIGCATFLIYKLIKSIMTGNWSGWSNQTQAENPQEIEIKKYYQLIVPYIGIVFVAFTLLKLKVISETIMIVIVLPSLLAGLFVFRLRQKYSETRTGVLEVIIHPYENMGLFIQLCFSAAICLIFLVPLLIITF